MGFKILNLDLQSFADVCHKLETKVADDGYVPDIVIDIPRGGSRMCPYIFSEANHAEITLVRPPKGVLKNRLKNILKYMPRFVNDWLRKTEARHLVRRKKHMDNTTIILPALDSSIRHILLIDDAVDSGATLKAIADKFSCHYPSIEIRTAVITVTGEAPVYMPQYCMFNDSTLIRTPWSIDSH